MGKSHLPEAIFTRPLVVFSGKNPIWMNGEKAIISLIKVAKKT